MEIIATLRKNGVEYTRVFSCWDLYYEHTFDPNIEILDVKYNEF